MEKRVDKVIATNPFVCSCK